MATIPESLADIGLGAADLSATITTDRNDMFSVTERDAAWAAIRDKMYPNNANRPANALAHAKLMCISYFAINSGSSGVGSFKGVTRIDGQDFRHSAIYEVVGGRARQFARSFATEIHDYLTINPDLAEACATKVGLDPNYKFWAYDVAEYARGIPVDAKAAVLQHFSALARGSDGKSTPYVTNPVVEENLNGHHGPALSSVVSETTARQPRRNLT